MKVLLMGNPNVGKSVIFSRLTGTSVTSSNYAGTTVEYKKGLFKHEGKNIELIDVPGTYTLDPTNKAEEVAVEMLQEGDIVFNIVDATNLERNLNLTLQLLERDIPVVILLNMWDETKHKGIDIDLEKLQNRLKVPVIPTVATTGKGLKEALNYLEYREIKEFKKLSNDERWAKIGHIINNVQRIKPKHHSSKELLEEYTLKPWTGIPIAGIVLYLTFIVIRFIGEGLITYVAEPFFEGPYHTFLLSISNFINEGTFLHDLLIGQLVNGQIDFEQSFGLLTTGIFIPFAAVLPYIISFYFVLSILEDSGYLPRLAVLLDNLMHKVGLHGFSIIPMILGFGCNVPAALAARNLDSKREQFIASTLMSISIPCMAQTAMIIGLVGAFGGIYVSFVFTALFIVWIIVGLLLNYFLPGYSSDLLIEIPTLRRPLLDIVFKKLWMRVINFLKEAIPFVLLGVLAVNTMYALGFFDLLTRVLGPVFSTLFGLPKEVISALLMGFLRKDLAMGMLAPLDLTIKQLVIASTILTVYFPCVATFIILFRELGLNSMLKSAGVMVLTAITVGTILNIGFNTTLTTVITISIIFIIIFVLYKLTSKKQQKIVE
ncbi:MAG: ferrous iron transporter B [Halanaerobiales bacterium]|nr:ferrous iron transporter B [Halanaerobiales bacterium]